MFKSKSSKSTKQAVLKQEYLENCHRTYSCVHCKAHLANHDELISKLFQGNHGRAYLFNRVINIGCKQAVQRELLTGLHAVADIYCDSCQTVIGWYYERAYEPSQRYKEGKYIIELVHMLKENQWDLTSYNVRELLKEARGLETKQSIANRSFQIGDKLMGLCWRKSRMMTADKSVMIEPAKLKEVVDKGDSGDNKKSISLDDKHDSAQRDNGQSSGAIAKATQALGRLEIKTITNDVEQLGSSKVEISEQLEASSLCSLKTQPDPLPDNRLSALT